MLFFTDMAVMSSKIYFIVFTYGFFLIDFFVKLNVSENYFYISLTELKKLYIYWPKKLLLRIQIEWLIHRITGIRLPKSVLNDTTAKLFSSNISVKPKFQFLCIWEMLEMQLKLGFKTGFKSFVQLSKTIIVHYFSQNRMFFTWIIHN